MKHLFSSFLVLFLFVWVSGYFKKNGTYVPGYYRTTPNQYKWDNYSYRPSQGLYNQGYGSGMSNYYYNNYYKPSYDSYGYSWNY